MDITPELIAEIDFPDALKGFDKDAVDDFLGQVGTELGRVHYELRKAERRIAELEDEVARAGAQAPAEATESDASKATRTIMAAQETADRIESDATTEAEKTLADAKSEADAAIEVAASEAKRLLAEAHTQAERLEGDARREADEMLVAGKRRAEDEYDARVADYVRLLGEQEQRSDALANDIDALEARVGEYRSVLERLVEEVRRVLDDPDELRFRPTLELSAPAAPVGSPAPVPGSVMPDDPAGVDVQEAVPGDEGWEQGSWSADLEGHPDDAATPDEVADGGLPEDGPVGEDGLGELDPVHEATDADDHPSTSEMALPPIEADDAVVGEDGLDPEQHLDAEQQLDPGQQFDPEQPFDSDATFGDGVDFDAPPPVDEATRDDLTFGELSAGAEATSVFERPGVDDGAAFPGDLTGEYHEVDPGDRPGAPASGDGAVPSQLQAFAGDVDSLAGQPYVPKKFQETTGAVPSAATGPALDVADDAFTESGSPRTPEPPEMPAGVEFVDLGEDQPGSAAFSAEPGAFAGDDPYLSDLHDAVNNPDDTQAFTEFGAPGEGDDDDDQKGLRRFFGR